MYELYCRSYQQVMKQAMKLLPWREPRLVVGENQLRVLPMYLKERHLENVLIVTDSGIVQANLLTRLLPVLDQIGMTYSIYDTTQANPTIENIEEATVLYNDNQCQGIIAFGGGSPIDCAKGVCARIARPNKTIPEMRGLLKVRAKIPPFIVIPTTAGTGSEATLAAVVSNYATKEKYALMDISLIPHYTILDPLLTVALPKEMTAATGMDALTHAIEAFIGNSNTKETRRWSIEATKMIVHNLPLAYEEPSNISAREKMLIASHFAGKAFTRAYVGNIHAIAHTLSAFYQVPHGLANAMLLPVVLTYYGKYAEEKLAILACESGIGNINKDPSQNASLLIEHIQKLNQQLKIPTKLAEIKENEIPAMAKQAFVEANPLYPVPKIFSFKDFENILHIIKK